MRRIAVFSAVWLSALAAVVLGHQGNATTSRTEDRNVAAVRAVIDAQEAAWNRGDVAGYMEGYAKDDATTFISGDSITRGWQLVLDRYKKNYDTREKMGTLAFSDLAFTPLAGPYMLATGRWQLTRSDGAPHGRFTLIFRQTPAGWRIVHDHTSSAP